MIKKEENILIVDDTPDNLRVLSTMLESQGYQVKRAISGKFALQGMQIAKPDLILLDVNMPEMNGYEVCKKLKSTPETKEIPIIFISALDKVIDKVKAFEVGGVDYITKPFQCEDVLARVRNQLTLRSLQKQLLAQNALLQQEIQERQKAEEETQLLLTLTQAVSLASDFSDALLAVLSKLCEAIGFSYGEAWIGSADGTVLECSPTWYVDRIGKDAAQIATLERFRQHSEGLTFRPDEELPGRVWYRGQPEILDISEASSSVFFRAALAKECGLTTGLAVPIVGSPISSREDCSEQNSVLAVLVFFLESRQEDERVIKLVRAVAAQLGRVMQQKQAEENLRQSEAREREKAQELELTLDTLKRTQAQLIQAEKMSSLGQMVAGVAHEINNPVSFISGNLTYAKEYFQDLLRLLAIYQQTYPHITAEIRELAAEIDLEFVVKDWSKLMDSMQAGAARIHQIVRSLKSFSRLDESELKSVDIHEGIDHTLLILQHRLRAEGVRPAIEVIKDYGQLPKVTCYASQLNQVFMNLLSNAIDALVTQPSPRVITICTRAVSGQGSVVSGSEQLPTDKGQRTTDFAVIRIADNGSGMSEAVLRKIFDPFFTTKPVGSGTGLGLSISYQIVVRKHGGQIRCHSRDGQGTEFVIELPIVQGEMP